LAGTSIEGQTGKLRWNANLQGDDETEFADMDLGDRFEDWSESAGIRRLRQIRVLGTVVSCEQLLALSDVGWD